jgi:hypothetical protein
VKSRLPTPDSRLPTPCPLHPCIPMIEVRADLPYIPQNGSNTPNQRRQRRSAKRTILRCPVPGCPRVATLPGDGHIDDAEHGARYGAPLSRWSEESIEQLDRTLAAARAKAPVLVRRRCPSCGRPSGRVPLSRLRSRDYRCATCVRAYIARRCQQQRRNAPFSAQEAQ